MNNQQELVVVPIASVRQPIRAKRGIFEALSQTIVCGLDTVSFTAHAIGNIAEAADVSSATLLNMTQHNQAINLIAQNAEFLSKKAELEKAA